MKKITLLSIFLLALTATAAMAAGGIDLVWDDYYGYGNGGAAVTKWACWSDFGKTGGPANPPCTDYASPCDADDEFVGMMCSFKLDAAMSDFFSTTEILDGQMVGASLPPWWEMWNPGSCRPNAITADGAYTTTKAYKKGCLDPYLGNASGLVIAYQSPQFPVSPALQSSLAGPNTFRIKSVMALVNPVALNATNEYYACGLTITFENTLASPGPQCLGCLAVGRITLNEILVDGLTSSQRLQAQLHNRSITWHGGAGTDPTPARNSTWGQVKSLYR
jgi:hypothetical protein